MFNNVIILVLLFDKTAKLLLSIMIWLDRVYNPSYEFAQRQNVVIDHFIRNEILNKHCYLASMLLKHIDNDEICDIKCGTRRTRPRTSAIIE